jgi:hypothetical protein
MKLSKLFVGASLLWCLSAVPASAQFWHSAQTTHKVVYGGTISATCEAEASYPGNRAGVETKITYPDGHQIYNWQYANDYIHVSIPFDLSEFTDHNQTEADCESDFWGMPGDGGGGWYFDWTWTAYLLTYTTEGTAFEFEAWQPSDTYGCSYAPGVVETARFKVSPSCPAYPASTFRPGGMPPIVSDSQAVRVAYDPVKAYTCGSTVPATMFTQYLWNTKFLGITLRTTVWFEWWDGTCYVEQ